MTPANESSPIEIAWTNYIKSVKKFMVIQKKDRPLDQFLDFKNAVFVIVEGREFLANLRMGFNQLNKSPDIQNALLLELESFSRSVEVAQAINKKEKKKSWRTMAGKLFGRASTVAGSVSDILDKLPPYAKCGITLFKELIDLFKGKDE